MGYNPEPELTSAKAERATLHLPGDKNSLLHPCSSPQNHTTQIPSVKPPGAVGAKKQEHKDIGFTQD